MGRQLGPSGLVLDQVEQGCGHRRSAAELTCRSHWGDLGAAFTPMCDALTTEVLTAITLIDLFKPFLEVLAVEVGVLFKELPHCFAQQDETIEPIVDGGKLAARSLVDVADFCACETGRRLGAACGAAVVVRGEHRRGIDVREALL